MFSREVTEEQFDWCVALRPYVQMQAPKRGMTKVELAKFVWAYQQMSQDDQDRHYPYTDE